MEHTIPDRARGAADMDDRTALEKRLAEARASIQERIRRIEREVGPGPKAIWASARKRPVVTLLAAALAGLLFGNLVFRKRRRVRTVDPVRAAPPAPPSPPAPPVAPASGGPGVSGGGMRYVFWITLLQTGLGLFADVATDFFAKRSGGAQRIFREERGETRREEAPETQDLPPNTENRSSAS